MNIYRVVYVTVPNEKCDFGQLEQYFMEADDPESARKRFLKKPEYGTDYVHHIVAVEDIRRIYGKQDKYIPMRPIIQFSPDGQKHKLVWIPDTRGKEGEA